MPWYAVQAAFVSLHRGCISPHKGCIGAIWAYLVAQIALVRCSGRLRFAAQGLHLGNLGLFGSSNCPGTLFRPPSFRSTGAAFRSTGAAFRQFGPIWGSLRALCGPTGDRMGRSGGPLAVAWGALRTHWGSTEALWGPNGSRLGRSGDPLGIEWGALEAHWGSLGDNFPKFTEASQKPR